MSDKRKGPRGPYKPRQKEILPDTMLDSIERRDFSTVPARCTVFEHKEDADPVDFIYVGEPKIESDNQDERCFGVYTKPLINNRGAGHTMAFYRIGKKGDKMSYIQVGYPHAIKWEHGSVDFDTFQSKAAKSRWTTNQEQEKSHKAWLFDVWKHQTGQEPPSGKANRTATMKSIAIESSRPDLSGSQQADPALSQHRGGAKRPISSEIQEPRPRKQKKTTGSTMLEVDNEGASKSSAADPDEVSRPGPNIDQVTKGNSITVTLADTIKSKEQESTKRKTAMMQVNENDTIDSEEKSAAQGLTNARLEARIKACASELSRRADT